MPDFSSCLFQGYGVLAGPPARLHATLIDHHYAILEWMAPKVLPESVTEYHLFIRKLGYGDEYMMKVEKQSPIILEDLQSSTYYETFVVAVNAHGRGAPSPRLIFQTKTASTAASSTETVYNMTQCCHASGLLPQCMALCTYDIRMSDLQQLSGTCGFQVGVLAKCAAAGRDHTPCCNRRAVPSECMSLCHGVLPPKGTECLPFAGNILQCLEEGSTKIPGPILELRATSVRNTSVSLMWIPAEEDQINETNSRISDYLVQYGRVDNQTIYETIVRMENEINTTNTDIDLENLQPNALYRFVVTARGPYGSSLPSSMLLINTSLPVDSRAEVLGAPSSPHSLAVSGHSATSITVTWQPPEFSHPHEPITYRYVLYLHDLLYAYINCYAYDMVIMCKINDSGFLIALDTSIVEFTTKPQRPTCSR